jgi:hypothetical protein
LFVKQKVEKRTCFFKSRVVLLLAHMQIYGSEKLVEADSLAAASERGEEGGWRQKNF